MGERDSDWEAASLALPRHTYNLLSLCVCFFVVCYLLARTAPLWRSVLMLRHSAAGGNIVNVRGLGEMVHAFERCYRNHLHSIAHTRQALPPQAVRALRMPVELKQETLRAVDVRAVGAVAAADPLSAAQKVGLEFEARSERGCTVQVFYGGRVGTVVKAVRARSGGSGSAAVVARKHAVATPQGDGSGSRVLWEEETKARGRASTVSDDGSTEEMISLYSDDGGMLLGQGGGARISSGGGTGPAYQSVLSTTTSERERNHVASETDLGTAPPHVHSAAMQSLLTRHGLHPAARTGVSTRSSGGGEAKEETRGGLAAPSSPHRLLSSSSSGSSSDALCLYISPPRTFPAGPFQFRASAEDAIHFTPETAKALFATPHPSLPPLQRANSFAVAIRPTSAGGTLGLGRGRSLRGYSSGSNASPRAGANTGKSARVSAADYGLGGDSPMTVSASASASGEGGGGGGSGDSGGTDASGVVMERIEAIVITGTFREQPDAETTSGTTVTAGGQSQDGMHAQSFDREARSASDVEEKKECMDEDADAAATTVAAVGAGIVLPPPPPDTARGIALPPPPPDTARGIVLPPPPPDTARGGLPTSRHVSASMQDLVVVTKNGSYAVQDIFGMPTTDSDEEDTCCICLTNPNEVTLLPCRHLCVCNDCLPHLDKCPVCRSNFDEYIVIIGQDTTSGNSAPAPLPPPPPAQLPEAGVGGAAAFPQPFDATGNELATTTNSGAQARL